MWFLDPTLHPTDQTALTLDVHSPPVANGAIAAAAMIAAVSHPKILAVRPFTCLPMRRRLLDIRITTKRNGAAATPLITATTTSSLIGLTCRRLNAVPPTVPRARRP